ncbi:DUF5659 domain-containing protein [Desulfitobacterium sp. PCE1]|uniref:DUF5659 domain-containing protein n=1 Tax=Desulfitobacterium sp. PCE1 TaxID=146907 RepID=UPI00037BB11A
MQYANTDDGKLIFSPMVAKFLLSRNFQIIDLKSDRNDRNRTIFVFKKDDGIMDAIHDYSRSKRTERGTHGEEGVNSRES